MSPANLRTEHPAALLASPGRLAAVRKTGLLDTPPEPAFDQLTELAAEILGVPAAFFSLVEETRDFYKSAYGFSEPLCSLRQLEGRTFCHYALQADGPLIVHDTREHPVFRDVPTVQTLGVAAYAGVPLHSEDGHAIGAFCVIDFKPRVWTDREIALLTKLAQATLREIKFSMALHDMNKKAEENRYAAMAREEFLARVAHDLRNPLSSATIGLAILEYAKLSEKELETLQTTRHVLESMNVIIEDLLNISQFESGKFRLRCAPVESAILLKDAREVLAGLAENKNIALTVVEVRNLPPVEADYERILRVFSNLVGNAVKFCPSGGAVHLTAAKVGDKVRFQVTDNGPGIAAENVSRLFDRFWQSNDADQRGLGLGLSIVKAIVEAHQGNVGVESALGKGATFWFSLPVAVSTTLRSPIRNVGNLEFSLA